MGIGDVSLTWGVWVVVSEVDELTLNWASWSAWLCLGAVHPGKANDTPQPPRVRTWPPWSPYALAVLTVLLPASSMAVRSFGVSLEAAGLSIFGLTLLGTGAVASTAVIAQAVRRDAARRTRRLRDATAHAALLDLGEALQRERPLEHLAPRALARLRAALAVDAAAIYLGDPQRGAVQRLAVCGAPELPPRIEAGTGGLPAPIAALTPIQSADRVLGCIAVAGRRRRLRGCDSGDEMIGLIAAELAAAAQTQALRERIDRQQREIEELLQQVSGARLAPPPPVSPTFEDIVGSSPALAEVLHLAGRVARSEIPVLITGETGTGKELLARAVHRLSSRAERPFVCVNCPAIPDDLAESQLFGHARGAFTGATEAHDGMFVHADGGTIFLDEVGDLPPPIQVKLLRVLQEGEVQRVGSASARRVDVRIVSATNRDLREEVARGRFREDLYHRLAGIALELPPLRVRREDIAALAHTFLARAADKQQRDLHGFTQEALDLLTAYHWPGNVRELQNVIERAVLLCGDHAIAAAHLVGLHREPLAGDEAPGAGRLLDALNDQKVRMVRDALAQVGGNQAAAARLLGMSRSNLNRLLKRYRLRARDDDET